MSSSVIKKDPITLLIADDEAPARKRLRDLLADQDDFKIIGEAENGDQVLNQIVTRRPDAAILDINMPGASVFSTIPSLKEPPLVIFQTAYSEYGVKAFDINALDYLMKPVSRTRFNRALDKLKAALTPQAVETGRPVPPSSLDVLSVKSGESIRIIKIQGIRRISFEEGFSRIYCAEGELYSDRSLGSYEEQLESLGFYRISRCDLINLSLISRIHPLFKGQYMVELQDGERLTVSRRRTAGLKERIGGI